MPLHPDVMANVGPLQLHCTLDERCAHSIASVEIIDPVTLIELNHGSGESETRQRNSSLQQTGPHRSGQ